MKKTVLFDNHAPIHYYIFPFDLKKGNKVYKISTAAKPEIPILKKEEKLQLIEDEVPTKNTLILYSEPQGISLNFIEDMIRSWLKYVFEIPEQTLIISISQLKNDFLRKK